MRAAVFVAMHTIKTSSGHFLVAMYLKGLPVEGPVGDVCRISCYTFPWRTVPVCGVMFMATEPALRLESTSL